jgi:hypothetical protein
MKLVLRSGISCRRAFSTGQRMAQSKFEYVRNFEQDDKVGPFIFSILFKLFFIMNVPNGRRYHIALTPNLLLLFSILSYLKYDCKPVKLPTKPNPRTSLFDI